jgi:hypothetical protein
LRRKGYSSGKIFGHSQGGQIDDEGRGEEMKKTLIRDSCVTVSLIALSIVVPPALAEIYHSPYGFSLDLPSHWWNMNSEKIKNNPALYDFDAPKWKNRDTSMLKMIAAGKLEIYWNSHTEDNTFVDNIHVVKRTFKIPQDNSEMKVACDDYPSQISKMYGKPLKIHSCGLRKISGLNALYIEHDGIIDKTRSVTYLIPFKDDVAIMFTLVCRNEFLEKLRKEYDDILASIRMEDERKRPSSENRQQKSRWSIDLPTTE